MSYRTMALTFLGVAALAYGMMWMLDRESASEVPEGCKPNELSLPWCPQKDGLGRCYTCKPHSYQNFRPITERDCNEADKLGSQKHSWGCRTRCEPIAGDFRSYPSEYVNRLQTRTGSREAPALYECMPSVQVPLTGYVLATSRPRTENCEGADEIIATLRAQLAQCNSNYTECNTQRTELLNEVRAGEEYLRECLSDLATCEGVVCEDLPIETICRGNVPECRPQDFPACECQSVGCGEPPPGQPWCPWEPIQNCQCGTTPGAPTDVECETWPACEGHPACEVTPPPIDPCDPFTDCDQCPEHESCQPGPERPLWCLEIDRRYGGECPDYVVGQDCSKDTTQTSNRCFCNALNRYGEPATMLGEQGRKGLYPWRPTTGESVNAADVREANARCAREVGE